MPAAAKTYDPWVLPSGGFGGELRSMGYVPPSVISPVWAGGTAAGPGMLLANAARGGVYRSGDCGDSWEPINGGAPWGDQIAGGFPGVCTPGPGQTCTHRAPFLSPPASSARSMDAGEAIVGTRRPHGYDVSRAEAVWTLWRGGVDGPYFSTNAGSDWASLSMVCLPGAVVGDGTVGEPTVRIVAVDEGDPNHIIAVRQAELLVPRSWPSPTPVARRCS